MGCALCDWENVSKNYNACRDFTAYRCCTASCAEKKADGKYEYETPVSYWMLFTLRQLVFTMQTGRGTFGGAGDQRKPWLCQLPPASEAAALYLPGVHRIPVLL